MIPHDYTGVWTMLKQLNKVSKVLKEYVSEAFKAIHGDHKKYDLPCLVCFFTCQIPFMISTYNKEYPSKEQTHNILILLHIPYNETNYINK